MSLPLFSRPGVASAVNDRLHAQSSPLASKAGATLYPELNEYAIVSMPGKEGQQNSDRGAMEKTLSPDSVVTLIPQANQLIASLKNGMQDLTQALSKTLCTYMYIVRIYTYCLTSYSLSHSPTQFTHSLTHSLTLIHSLTHPLTYSYTPLTHPLIHPLTHSFIHSLTHSLTHPPTHSPTHSLTYPLTCSFPSPSHLSCMQKHQQRILSQLRGPSSNWPSLKSQLHSHWGKTIVCMSQYDMSFI